MTECNIFCEWTSKQIPKNDLIIILATFQDHKNVMGFVQLMEEEVVSAVTPLLKV